MYLLYGLQLSEVPDTYKQGPDSQGCTVPIHLLLYDWSGLSIHAVLYMYNVIDSI